MHKYTGNYYVESSGYPTILKIFNGNVNGLSLLISLFFIKMLVTFLTLGSGASGGIFSPSLFM
jgi:CIC family chloride channel protein